MAIYWLLARADFSEISQHARDSGSGSTGNFIIGAIIAIVVFWAALHYWSRLRKQYLHNSNDPKSLYLELCRVHRLNRAERGLLLRAIEMQKPAQPGLLFVDPEPLGAMQRSSSPDAEAFAALSDKLFGGDADKASTAEAG